MRVRVHNVGAMEAERVKVRVFARDLQTLKRQPIGETEVPEIGVGKLTVKPDKEFKPTKGNKAPPVTWKDVNGVRVPLRAGPSHVRMDRRMVEAKWTPTAAGHYRVEVEIAPSPQYTLLDGYAEKVVVVTGTP